MKTVRTLKEIIYDPVKFPRRVYQDISEHGGVVADGRLPKILLPMIGRTFPELVASEIVGVQPVIGCDITWPYQSDKTRKILSKRNDLHQRLNLIILPERA